MGESVMMEIERYGVPGELKTVMFSEPYTHKDERRRGINSVEIGMRILQCVVDMRRAASLTEIAKSAKMSSSQVHRYVSSLVNSGMLKQDKASGHYDLGPTALRTGLAAIARQDALAQAETGARQFCEKRNATVLLAVWSADGPVIMRWFHGTPPTYTMLTIGSRLPLTSSSTGRMFMAFLPDPLLNKFLAIEGRPVPLKANPDLVDVRAAARANMMASVDGTVTPGLRACSAPIFAVDNRLVAVMTVVASDTIPRTLDDANKAALLAACRDLTADLGGNWATAGT